MALIVITNRDRSLVNVPAGFDDRDAIAPPGCAPYRDPRLQIGEPPTALTDGGSIGSSLIPRNDDAIVPQYRPSAKTFSTMRAQSARAGHELTQRTDEKTGLVLWQVGRWGQMRQFSEWSEVCEFVARLGQSGSASMGAVYLTIGVSTAIILACLLVGVRL